jgi:hypothetical protein
MNQGVALDPTSACLPAEASPQVVGAASPIPPGSWPVSRSERNRWLSTNRHRADRLWSTPAERSDDGAVDRRDLDDRL